MKPIKFNKFKKNFLIYLKIERNYSSLTIWAYQHDLKKFSEFLKSEVKKCRSIEQVDKFIIRKFLSYLNDKGNGSCARARKLATLKSFFKFLHQEGLINHNPAAEVKMPKIDKKELSFLTQQEYQKLLQIIKTKSQPFLKERDYAIAILFLGSGIRLRELLNLNVADIDLEHKWMKIKRKGNKEQYIPLNDQVIAPLKSWLEKRGKILGSRKKVDALFISTQKRRMTPMTVQGLIKKYMMLAGLKKSKMSPHTLRHTFATSLIANGGNLMAIKELLGHQSLETTEKYLHVTNKQLIKEVNKISL